MVSQLSAGGIEVAGAYLPSEQHVTRAEDAYIAGEEYEMARFRAAAAEAGDDVAFGEQS